jgi:hypothetical protein
MVKGACKKSLCICVSVDLKAGNAKYGAFNDRKSFKDYLSQLAQTVRL